MKIQFLSAAAASVALFGTGAPALMAASADAGFTVHELSDDGKKSSFSGNPKSRLPMLKNPPKATRIRTPSRRDGVPGSSLDKGRKNDAYGTAKWSYTTSTVQLQSKPKKKDVNAAVSARPYLSAGKVFMKFGNSSYVCSGSMLGKGIVITAAHCISEWGKGKSGFATDVYFIPGATKRSNSASSGPAGRWKAKNLVAPTCYLNGTCKNTASGVLSSNDLGMIILGGKKKQLPGYKKVGYYGYGWNGYGFTTGSTLASSKSMAQITQLGYPAAIGDKSSNLGGAMIRTDSPAMYYLPASGVKNLLWGSSQTGGSSGGPELVNFGKKPTYGSGSSAGVKTLQNIVIGVTSWGYTSPVINLQGASWFGQNDEYPAASYTDTAGKNWGAGNIGALMRYTCGKGSSYLGLQAKGWCR